MQSPASKMGWLGSEEPAIRGWGACGVSHGHPSRFNIRPVNINKVLDKYFQGKQAESVRCMEEMVLYVPYR